MLPTPDTSHVGDLPVYPPSEDSFLMLDALEAQKTFLTARFPCGQAPMVLEVGAGSGVVIAFLAAHCVDIFGQKNVPSMAVDINPFACRAAQKTVELAVGQSSADGGRFLNAFVGDLAAPLRPGSIDVLVFNPPYVPSDALPDPVHITRMPTATDPLDFDTESRLFDLAVSGGPDGMVVTWRLLDQLSHVLSDRGVCYILLCARNKPAAIMSTLRQKGWIIDQVGSSGQKGGIEKLCIVRIAR